MIFPSYLVRRIFIGLRPLLMIFVTEYNTQRRGGQLKGEWKKVFILVIIELNANSKSQNSRFIDYIIIYPSIHMHPFIHLYPSSLHPSIHHTNQPYICIPPSFHPSICNHPSIGPSIHLHLLIINFYDYYDGRIGWGSRDGTCSIFKCSLKLIGNACRHFGYQFIDMLDYTLRGCLSRIYPICSWKRWLMVPLRHLEEDCSKCHELCLWRNFSSLLFYNFAFWA